ncbi:hypothetical protein [Sneathiella glossodoripedis]|uniref:hypothetical protein n=1 Tax=Sneathiella glossodoripedis TaxID=418853 RepID=UPI0004718AC1|nr:hypothetical protein [Sneathiella glossodoripedis]
MDTLKALNKMETKLSGYQTTLRQAAEEIKQLRELLGEAVEIVSEDDPNRDHPTYSNVIRRAELLLKRKF